MHQLNQMPDHIFFCIRRFSSSFIFVIKNSIFSLSFNNPDSVNIYFHSIEHSIYHHIY